MKDNLKTIPRNTINFIIEGNEGAKDFQVIAQKKDKTKHILHKHLTQDESISIVTKYLIKHRA